jgi:hypothetical protein
MGERSDRAFLLFVVMWIACIILLGGMENNAQNQEYARALSEIRIHTKAMAARQLRIHPTEELNGPEWLSDAPRNVPAAHAQPTHYGDWHDSWLPD